ncbi:MAG: rod shape-determining protein [Clostridia bacterium]|nr:rod shape-determining protein [Clostridia bacterium]
MKSIGIDLGTANSRIFVKGKGIILREPSAVAVSETTEEVLAVGLDASRMAGKTPDDVSVRRPIKSGVIAQFDAAVAMVDVFLQKAGTSLSGRPRVMVCVPYSINDVERRAVEEVILEAGAKSVALIESSLVAAIGAGLRVTHPRGSMIVDIGGGTTEIAVMSLGAIVVARSVRIAGDTLDDAICDYIRRKYNVTISDTTAEYVKRSIGSIEAKIAGSSAAPKEMEIRGRNVITGLPVAIKVTGEDMAEAMAEPIAGIVDAIRATLENTPPELAADLLEDGIVLSGGGALLGGLPALISKVTHLKVSIAKNPLDCSVLGLGRLLEYTGDVDRIIRFRTK